MQVVHTAIWVSDLNQTKEIFMDELSLEYVKDFEGSDGVTNFYVAGDGGASIQLKYDSEGEYEIEPKGIDHLSLSVDDSEQIAKNLDKRNDCEIVSGPKTVNDTVSEKRVTFVEIPDRYVLELEQNLE